VWIYVLILSSPRFEEHTTPPGHPESPERARVFERVTEIWIDKGVSVLAPRAATRDELLRVHHESHLRSLERTAGRGVALDADTFTSPESYEVALLAAGAAIQAVEHALDTREPAVALVRPPGHHAEPDRAMGFCLFNNVAAAAAAAVARGLSRVAVVDIDVHHGNGTQRIFYDDPKVLYVSTHQFPFYPGTGAAHEIGTGPGEGFTVNVPLEAGATDADYLYSYAGVAAVLEQFVPELLLVSAGFDAHEDDPLASMRVTTGGYASIMRILRTAAARDHLRCPIAVVTEGGYDLEALRACTDSTIEVLAAPAVPAVEIPASHPRADRAWEAVRSAHRGRWRAI
jgi:acetoin utilization deacetylase AcuC-like enzyme